MIDSNLGNSAEVGVYFSRITHAMADKNGATGANDRAVEVKGHQNLTSSEINAVIDAARAAAKTCGGLCKSWDRYPASLEDLTKTRSAVPLMWNNIRDNVRVVELPVMMRMYSMNLSGGALFASAHEAAARVVKIPT